MGTTRRTSLDRLIDDFDPLLSASPSPRHVGTVQSTDTSTSTAHGDDARRASPAAAGSLTRPSARVSSSTGANSSLSEDLLRLSSSPPDDHAALSGVGSAGGGAHATTTLGARQGQHQQVYSDPWSIIEEEPRALTSKAAATRSTRPHHHQDTRTSSSATAAAAPLSRSPPPRRLSGLMDPGAFPLSSSHGSGSGSRDTSAYPHEQQQQRVASDADGEAGSTVARSKLRHDHHQQRRRRSSSAGSEIWHSATAEPVAVSTSPPAMPFHAHSSLSSSRHHGAHAQAHGDGASGSTAQGGQGQGQSELSWHSSTLWDTLKRRASTASEDYWHEFQSAAAPHHLLPEGAIRHAAEAAGGYATSLASGGLKAWRDAGAGFNGGGGGGGGDRGGHGTQHHQQQHSSGHIRPGSPNSTSTSGTARGGGNAAATASGRQTPISSSSSSSSRVTLGFEGASTTTTAPKSRASPSRPASASTNTVSRSSASVGSAPSTSRSGTTSPNPIRLKGLRPGVQRVLQEDVAEALRPHLPARYRLSFKWQLVYSLDQHGISLSTMYDRMRTATSTTRSSAYGSSTATTAAGIVLVVKDDRGDVFGAYVNEPLREHRGYYGDGSCFLWKATPFDPGDFRVGSAVRPFKWTGRNNYLILTESSYVSIGGGDGKYGLWLDAHLEKGVSARCPCFANEPLTSEWHESATTGAQEGRFDVVGFEAWLVEM